MLFTLHAEQRLQAPSAEVWAVVDDFGAHHQFNPFIERSTITNGIPTGEGAERELRLYDGSVMHQRIADYRPGRSMVIEVVETTQLVRHHLVEISLEPETDESCVLAYKVSFKAPFGPLGYPLGVVHRVLLTSRYRHVLRGVARYVRSLREARS